jgi:hypothetical protein
MLIAFVGVILMLSLIITCADKVAKSEKEKKSSRNVKTFRCKDVKTVMNFKNPKSEIDNLFVYFLGGGSAY